ncbi:hypothetical protein CQA53_05930 [Helicobacter didelphidarum]|uniref:Uncharacterized protein n=1 Tax=Helicobacter didelphidarum TaxID=2040648 RepID=A0A3D8IKG9_9HELI|nr:hypothetical protein [Helicobacter didelphidarum]RDU65699.1 hypothetical protein CQA53_05930 [Helicobacter didelphidarum]
MGLIDITIIGDILNRIFNILTQYLLKKSLLERVIFLGIFLCIIYIITDNLKHEREIIVKQYVGNIGEIHKDIFNLTEKYEIQNRCARLFCAYEEFFQNTNDQGYVRNSYNNIIQTNLHHKNIESKKLDSINKYYMYVSCIGIACYEFIRELENLPLVFITEIHGFNVEILDITHAQQPINKGDDLSNHIQEPNMLQRLQTALNTIEVDNTKTMSLPIKWRQELKVVFEIERIKI